MCGVTVALRPPGSPSYRSVIDQSLRLLDHRGPDGSGTFACQLPWAQVTLGMTRLKIVDQADLLVPYSYPHLGVTLAFNGEVYNWRALRQELGGDLWTSNCDAEVIAAGWRQYGSAFLDKMNGMWAFVLVDHLEKAVYLVRDRAGEKPLYYTEHDGGFHAASEIKALPGPLTEAPCLDVEAFEFDCGRETPFYGVHAVCPGELIECRGLEDRRLRTWWQLPHAPLHPCPSVEEAAEELEGLLTDAVCLRADADRPVGLQLSGGLDSAIVQSIVKSENLYCVSFDGTPFDAIPQAELARGGVTSPIHKVSFSADQLMAAMDQVVWHLDTPATWTAICLWFLYGKMAADGIKVTLSGEGADELFGGYSRYRMIQLLEDVKKDPWLANYGPLVNKTAPIDVLVARCLCRGESTEALLQVSQYLELAPKGRSWVNKLAYTEFYTTMQVLLRMADRMSAAYGMENRSPFLDYRVMELGAGLPAAYKTADGTKTLLRGVAERLGVHTDIVWDRNKRGLAVPWPTWSKELGLPQSGSPWDRSGFAALMYTAWRTQCCRNAH